MAFPQDPLPIKAELQIGGVWTDITGDVRAERQIRITRGRSDWGQDIEPSRCSLTLDNNSGKYSPKNPNGPYYGQIGRNTPVRVSVLTGTPYLDMPGGANDWAQTPDTAALDITGDLDVRLDAAFMNWLPPVGSGIGGTVEMMGKFNSSQKAWFIGARDGRLWFEWSANGIDSTGVSSTVAPVIPGSGRLAVRATLDVDNGNGGWTVTFFTAANLDAPWTQLGDPVSGTGATSIFNSNAPLKIGQATNFTFALPYGRVYSAEIRSGLWGTVVAQPYFSQQAVGATSFVDSAGRTWTLNGQAAITNRQTRFVGEATSWTPRWETKYDVTTQLEASGILRRLTQGASPVRSPMYREFTNPSRSGVVGYWPMEEETGATLFGSALPNGSAMRIPTSGVTLASNSDWVASAPLPVFTSGTARGAVNPQPSTGYIFTRVFVSAPAGGVSGTDRLFSFTTTGTARSWAVYINTAGSLDLRAYDSDGTQLLATGFVATAINGQPVQLAVELTQNGANINANLIVFYINTSTINLAAQGGIAATLNSQTVGSASQVQIGQDGLLNGTAIGHLCVANSNTTFSGTLGAMLGWNRETSDNRILRLAREEGLTAYAVNVSGETLGPQSRDTLVNLLREAEAADEGILCEGRTYLGLRLRNHTSLLNQAPALTLDYTGSSGLVTPLEPVDDDQQVRNDITATRTSGGSGSRLTLDTGTLSTQAPPAGVGRYTDSVTLNLADDSRTLDHAGWRLHLGTWDETRYPVVHMVLSKVPGLLEAAAGVNVGDRIQIANPPSWLPPDTIDLQVQGYTETIDQFTWNLDFNCSPAGPWDVAWAGDPVTASSRRELAWVDSDGSQIAEDLTATETDVDVLTTSGALWTPNVRDTPIDWRVGGEVMTVAAPGSLLNINPFFNTDASGWTGLSASISWSQNYVHPHPRAVASLRIAGTGASSASAACTMTDVGTINPGGAYVASAWVFSINGSTDLRPTIDWYDAGGALLSTSSGSAQSASASVWTYLEGVYTAPASASRAIVRLRVGNTPGPSDITYAWAIRLTRATSSSAADLFGRTVSGGWGIADTGQTWATSGGTAADYAVGSGFGSHTHPSTVVAHRTTIPSPGADTDVYCDLSVSAVATGAAIIGCLTSRTVDNNSHYMARLDFNTDATVTLRCRKRVSATETEMAAYASGIVYSAGTWVRLRFQTIGSTLRAKAWLAGAPEPEIWHFTVTDTDLTAAQNVGTRSFTNTGNTNASPQVHFGNFAIVNPQTYTVTRSANRVSKSQSAGTPVGLAYPTYVAL